MFTHDVIIVTVQYIGWARGIIRFENMRSWLPMISLLVKCIVKLTRMTYRLPDIGWARGIVKITL